jgi:tRNA pseudouridine13 synthase
MPDSTEKFDLPLLTADLEGIGGAIKTREEDFIVDELPLYQASGEGTHTYALIEKKGLATTDALMKIAKALRIRRKNIGFAGLKDTQAVTRQWISIENLDPNLLLQLNFPDVKILQTTRHRNKIRLGHLAANRFNIRIRNFKPPLDQAIRQIETILDILTRKGAPNYYGPQRFGSRNDGHLLGKAVITDQPEEFMDIFLGRPQNDRPTKFTAARTSYEQGDYEKAIDSWPRLFYEHRNALKELAGSGGNKTAAFNVVDKHLKRFYVSAYQSYIFNKVLVARMPHIDKLMEGDMAYKHENGACFRVENPQAEQSRCDAFEISPTGPIFGKRMTELTGPAAEIENPILQEVRELTPNFEHLDKNAARGGRRPLRFQPKDTTISAGQDDLGEYIQLQFDLPSGCYATILLREITKSNVS